MTAYPTMDTTGLHHHAEVVPIKPVADWGARLSYHSSGDSICDSIAFGNSKFSNDIFQSRIALRTGS